MTDSSRVEADDVILFADLCKRVEAAAKRGNAAAHTSCWRSGPETVARLTPGPPGPPGFRNTLPFLVAAVALNRPRAILATPALGLK